MSAIQKTKWKVKEECPVVSRYSADIAAHIPYRANRLFMTTRTRLKTIITRRIDCVCSNKGYAFPLPPPYKSVPEPKYKSKRVYVW